MQKFIIIGDADTQRAVTVFNGLPYYKSTGYNSGEKDMWFPFVMMVSDKPINFARIPAIYNKPLFLSAWNQAKKENSFYLIKHENTLLLKNKNDFLKTKLYDGRIPTKECLITSVKLGYKASIFSEDELRELGLTENEIKATKERIELAAHPELVSSNPNEINNWLVEQGASTATALLQTAPQSANSVTLFHHKEEISTFITERSIENDSSSETDRSVIEKGQDSVVIKNVEEDHSATEDDLSFIEHEDDRSEGRNSFEKQNSASKDPTIFATSSIIEPKVNENKKNRKTQNNQKNQKKHCYIM